MNEDYNSKGNSADYKYVRSDKNTTELPYDKVLELYHTLSATTIEKVNPLNKNTEQFCISYTNLMHLFIKFLSELETTDNSKPAIANLFNYIIYFLNEQQQGGTVTYNKTQYNNDIYPGNNIQVYEENNVIIVGAGPVGLYMGILLKKSNPDLHVIILENRIDDANMRYLSRANYIYLKKIVYLDNSAIGGKKITREDVLKFIIPQQNQNDFFPNSETFDLLFKIINQRLGVEHIQIKELEYILANYAQNIGVLIFHTKNEYTSFINNKTMVIFDATSGHLKNIKYSYYVDPIIQKIGDGVNINSLNFIPYKNNNIPIVSIGDSLYKGNYLNGYGTSTSFIMCFFISFYFTSVFFPPPKKPDILNEVLTPAVSEQKNSDTIAEVSILQKKYDKLLDDYRAILDKNNKDKEFLDRMYATRAEEIKRDTNKLEIITNQLQSQTNPSDLSQAYMNLLEDLKFIKRFLNEQTVSTIKDDKYIIPDKQFAPLVTLINTINPNDQLDSVQIARHNKERSNKKNGSSFTSFFKKTKGGKYKTRKSRKYKTRKSRKTRK